MHAPSISLDYQLGAFQLANGLVQEDFAVPGLPAFPIASAQTPVLDGNGNILDDNNCLEGQEPNPLRSIWNGESWNPLMLQAPQQENDVQYPPAPIYQTRHQLVARPPAGFTGYRESLTSDPGSYYTGTQQPDSGYETNLRSAQSVLSVDRHGHQQASRSLVGEVGDLHLHNNDIVNAYYYPQGAMPAPYPAHESPAVMPLACDRHGCDVVSKNPSESRKHAQRHNKPHVCHEPDCKRQKGFTTKNDLERHKKSVHGIDPTNTHDRSFYCKAAVCLKKDKKWPRLDNFKAHCNRMHPDEDVDDLVRKSEITPTLEATAKMTGAGLFPGTQASDTASISTYFSAPNFNLEISPDAHTIMFSDKPPVMERSESETTHAEAVVVNSGRSRRMSTAASSTESRDRSRCYEPFLSPTYKRWTPISKTRTSPSSVSTSQVERTPGTAGDTPHHDDDDGDNNDDLQQQQQHCATKSEQRLQALTVSGSNIEKVAKHLAFGLRTSLSLGHSSPEQLQSMIQTQMLNMIGSTSSHKRTSHDACLDEHTRPKAKRHPCRHCDKTMGRACDLNKHEKRHSRPWGCTHDECNKSFGSKNDWKRHENSQHCQLETWRCGESDATSKIRQCVRVFTRRDGFKLHLGRDHRIQDAEYIKTQLRGRRIGRNWQNGFWCGFCKDVIKLKSQNVEAWIERFDHIDDQHFKNNQRIDEWYPPDKDIPKGRLRLERTDRAASGSADTDAQTDDESDHDDSCGVELDPGRPPPGRRSAHHGDPEPSRRSGASTGDERAVQAGHWYCCYCRYGPNNSAWDLSCPECRQKKCSGCSSVDRHGKRIA